MMYPMSSASIHCHKSDSELTFETSSISSDYHVLIHQLTIPATEHYNEMGTHLQSLQGSI